MFENISSQWQHSKLDPKQLPLLDAWCPVWTITALYLLFIYKWGPWYMKNRDAYNLRNIVLTYNVLQVLVNVGMFVASFLLLFYHHVYEFGCFGFLAAQHPLKGLELGICYVYYLNKIMDYMDTVFFVLRKSFRQVTFLHVYHHAFMAFFCYYYIHNLGSGGQVMSVILLNTFVHAIMYGYYFLAAYQPQMKQSLWWKRYITLLQLVQFTLFSLHHLYPLLFRPNCGFPRLMLMFILSQSALLMTLFGNFYRKTYLNKGQSANRIVTNSKIE